MELSCFYIYSILITSYHYKILFTTFSKKIGGIFSGLKASEGLHCTTQNKAFVRRLKSSLIWPKHLAFLLLPFLLYFRVGLTEELRVKADKLLLQHFFVLPYFIPFAFSLRRAVHAIKMWPRFSSKRFRVALLRKKVRTKKRMRL